MSTENPNYIFANTTLFKEGLDVYKKEKLLIHWLDGNFMQAIGIVKDEIGPDYLEYDRFKDGRLCIGLRIRPNYPVTDLQHYFLGKIKVDGGIHAIDFMRGDPTPYYWSQEDGKKIIKRPGEWVVNWDNMCRNQSTKSANSFITDIRGPIKENWFAARLIPKSTSPIAQVSLDKGFRENVTLTLDTSVLLRDVDYRYLYEKVVAISGADSMPLREADLFCEDLTEIFEPFFRQ